MSDFTSLIDGYYRFRGTRWYEERDLWEELGKGQTPGVLVIACSDSRVDPATIFGTKPGQIFVVRNVANLVPPFEDTPGQHGVSAAIEFAVTKLLVKEIVVLGHGFCGGVKAALDDSLAKEPRGSGGFVAEWIGLLDDARDKVKASHGVNEAGERALEKEGVKLSIENLKTFPFVRAALDKGDLKLRGAVFTIADGKLRVLQDDGTFDLA